MLILAVTGLLPVGRVMRPEDPPEQARKSDRKPFRHELTYCSAA